MIPEGSASKKTTNQIILASLGDSIAKYKALNTNNQLLNLYKDNTYVDCLDNNNTWRVGTIIDRPMK